MAIQHLLVLSLACVVCVLCVTDRVSTTPIVPSASLTTPDVFVKGNISSSYSESIYYYKISTNQQRFEVQVVRTTPLLQSDSTPKYYYSYTTSQDSYDYVSLSSKITLNRQENSTGEYYVGVSAKHNTKYSYAIRYCVGTCQDVCKYDCWNNGGCNMTSKECDCDRGVTQYDSDSCGISIDIPWEFLGMSVAVFTVVLIAVIIFCVCLPVIICVCCCCGACACAVAGSSKQTNRTVVVHQNEENYVPLTTAPAY